MKSKQQGFSMIIIVVAVTVLAVTVSAGIFVVNKQSYINKSTNTAESSAKQNSPSENKSTVKDIEDNINSVNLENELPSEDLENDINSLL